VDHGVDAGGGGDHGRQAQGQGRIEDGKVGVELGCDHAHLGGGAGGDDGDVGDFGTGAGGGRHLHQRQALSADLADAVDVGKLLFAGGQDGDQFCHIHRAAAAEADHQVDVVLLGEAHRIRDHVFWRIGHHAGVDADRETVALQIQAGQFGQAGAQETGIGDDQRAARTGEAFAHDFAEAGGSPGFGNDVGDGAEGKGSHGLIRVLLSV